MAEIRTKGRVVHMRLDLKGALMNWHDSDWRNCVKDDDGRTLEPQDVKRQFIEEISRGHLFLPLGDCDNFSFTEGCLGHPDHDIEAVG